MSAEPESNLRWPNTGRVTEGLKRLAALPAADFAWPGLEQHVSGFAAGRPRSEQLAREAAALIPGGHHSLAVTTPFPLYFERALGPYVDDVDGNRYTDFVRAGGAGILDAGDETVSGRAIAALGRSGPATALPHPAELELARLVCTAMPAVERLRMTASGSEAVMAAVRIARAYTGAQYIVKIGGAYHGWSDQLLLALRQPGTGRLGVQGVPGGVLDTTQEIAPDDLPALRARLEANQSAGGTAAVLVEPLGPQSGSLPVDESYHAEVAQLCREFGALLVFDEVVTGFRLGMAGVQGHLGLEPDLTVLGKCLTGGYPASGAVGGRAEVMATLAPGGKAFAFVAGTLTANPLSCAAGVATLERMAQIDAPARASAAGDRLCAGLQRALAEYELPFVAYNFGSIVHLQSTGLLHLDPAGASFREHAAARRSAMQVFAVAAACEGLLIAPTGRMFTSAVHSADVIDEALERFGRLFALIAR